MSKVAQVECQRCHHLVPKNRAVKITKKVETGQSGMSVSYKPTPQRSKSVGWTAHSGRKYYRNKDFWYCSSCHTTNKAVAAEVSTTRFWVGFIGMFLLISWIGVTGPKGFEVFLSLKWLALNAFVSLLCGGFFASRSA